MSDTPTSENENPPNTRLTGSAGRGEEARRRLLDAGFQIFGRYGFEAASTRQLAEAAGVNLSAITYHFGSKEGLYRAVVSSMTQLMETNLAQVSEHIKAQLFQPDLSREEALEMIHLLLGRFLEKLLSIEEDIASRLLLIWIREQISPTSAFELLFNTVTSRMLGPLSGLLGRLLNKPASDPECRIRAFTLVGQVLIFRLARPAVLRTMGWESYSEESIVFIRGLIRQQLTEGLGSDSDWGRKNG